MSDSDEDLFIPNNDVIYQHRPVSYNATNFNSTHITNYSYRINTGSQRSVFTGRSGSPMSMRSIDSNASVSAADIALAFKNVEFNENDLRLIKYAYDKFMRNRIRKRTEKRRNRKIISRLIRRRSGEDSGEKGDDDDDDDCRSSRTNPNKENTPKSINRPFKTYDLTQPKTSIKESNVYKDCTENIQQNSRQNMYAVNTLNHNRIPEEKGENTSVATLRERFSKGASFQFLSQRFNKSKLINNNTAVRHTITENHRKYNDIFKQPESTKTFDTNSEKEEIFSQTTVKANSTRQISNVQRKRVLEAEEINSSNRKRNKTALSPIKENGLFNNLNVENNDFNFKKPKMPVRKISNVKKDAIPEILIAKSRQPLTGNLELDLSNSVQDLVVQNKEPLQNTAEVIEPDCSNQTEVTQNTTDVSMKPSFFKRKLFTQTLDVVENNDSSNDNFATNSPQTKIYNTCREKNKVRKIVSSQSCLSRDVLGDENVLDLIHKIVPPDQMNMTNATNKKELSKSYQENNNKWDVASVISMCNSDDGSDTFTDEEIFKVSQIANKTNKKKVNKKVDKDTAKEDKKISADCKVAVKKLEPIANSLNAAKTQCQKKRIISNYGKSFWDTDVESDMEEPTETPWTSQYQVKQDVDVHKNATKDNSNMNFNKRSITKGTILTVRSFQHKGVNSSVRSDISRVSRKKDYDYCLRQQEIQTQENDNKTLSKNTKPTYNDEKKVKEQIVPSTKPHETYRSKSNLSKVSNEKSNSKPIPTKEIKSKEQIAHNNECNTSRESLRLKQKKEQTKISSSTHVNDSTVHCKRGRHTKNSTEKNSDSILKKSQKVNKKSKETSNKDVKFLKNSTVKNAILNRTRQTPRKCNEKKQLSSSIDQSSLNISNILSRSLRVRRKNVNYFT